ncbi:hypothetical protein FCO27_19280, partial [Bacillus pumilus]|uniref:hypothetical protein n=1 Tax=Bacillus pumilus TaxID=1408 RepID=UPI0010BEB446
ASVFVIALGGCATGDMATSGSAAAGRAKALPKDLAPGEQVDYAGHRCGNPNLRVKMHPCVFPLQRVD